MKCMNILQVTRHVINHQFGLSAKLLQTPAKDQWAGKPVTRNRQEKAAANAWK